MKHVILAMFLFALFTIKGRVTSGFVLQKRIHQAARKIRISNSFSLEKSCEFDNQLNGIALENNRTSSN